MNTSHSPPETRRVICRVCGHSFIFEIASGTYWCKNGCTKISFYITEYWPIEINWKYEGGDNE